MKSTDKSIVYILKLENDCWYVGVTTQISKRMRKHFMSPKVEWLRKNKPIEIIHILDGDDKVEIQVTYDLIQLYGVTKVRGGWPYHLSNQAYRQDRIVPKPTVLIHEKFL